MGDNRGGYRQAPVGAHTPNRRDLQQPGQRINAGNVPRGQPYGQATQQARALAAVPTAGAPTSPTSTSTAPGPPVLAPGDVPGLNDPTAFPEEPVTAGLALGPGAGPEALGILPQPPEELGVVRALYAKYGYEEFRELMDWMENNL